MLQKRYEGFLNTPFLWKKDVVLKLNQFEIETTFNKIDLTIDENLRLGKYVEQLVSFQLKQQEDISVLAENIQIQNNKITLGELDCLLLKDNKTVHLEIIYKFYLYDDTVGENEIEHFIGPNRKDALTEKLTKLKDKQLPLLYNSHCKKYLDKLELKSEDIKQYVYFKAQLFVPYSNQNIQLKTLNTVCITGFYIKKNELTQFTNCKFYVPIKKDWLITPHANINWLNFSTFNTIANNYFDDKFSVLCWLKYKTGKIKKVFLVWW